MADARVAMQGLHMVLLENVADETVVLAGAEYFSVGRRHPCRVLASMLNRRERIVNLLVDSMVADDSDYPTHTSAPMS